MVAAIRRESGAERPSGRSETTAGSMTLVPVDLDELAWAGPGSCEARRSGEVRRASSHVARARLPPPEQTAIGATMRREPQHTVSRRERPDRASASTVSLPAELRFLEVARSAVRVGLAGSACDPGCDRDLQLATDELASILIVAAEHPAQLRLTVTDDETDAYVRMQVPASPAGGTPPTGELTRLLLDATVESYEITIEDDQLLGVLQRALVDDNQR